MGFTGSNLRSKFKQCTSCLFKLHVWHHHCSQVIAQDVLDQSEFFLWVLFPEGIDGSFSFLAWQGFPTSKNFQFPPNGVEFFQVGKIQPHWGGGDWKFHWGVTGWWGPEKEWFWPFEPFLKWKTVFCEYWTSIKIKISMICVYKEYEI